MAKLPRLGIIFNNNSYILSYFFRLNIKLVQKYMFVLFFGTHMSSRERMPTINTFTFNIYFSVKRFDCAVFIVVNVKYITECFLPIVTVS